MAAVEVVLKAEAGLAAAVAPAAEAPGVAAPSEAAVVQEEVAGAILRGLLPCRAARRAALTGKCLRLTAERLGLAGPEDRRT